MSKLNKLHSRQSHIYDKNPYKLINKKLFFSLFDLTKQQRKSIDYQFRKRYLKHTRFRPTLFCALIYWQGIPIHEVCKVVNDFYKIDVKRVLKLFSELNLKRTTLNDLRYWVYRYLGLFNNDLQSRIHKVLPKLVKLKVRINPKRLAQGIIYAALKPFGYSQKRIAKLLDSTEPSIRDVFHVIKDALRINSYYKKEVAEAIANGKNKKKKSEKL